MPVRIRLEARRNAVQAAHSRHRPDMFLCHAAPARACRPRRSGETPLRIVAQSVARPAGGWEAAGSNPVNPTDA